MFKWLKRMFTVKTQVNRRTSGYWTEYGLPGVSSSTPMPPVNPPKAGRPPGSPNRKKITPLTLHSLKEIRDLRDRLTSLIDQTEKEGTNYVVSVANETLAEFNEKQLKEGE